MLFFRELDHAMLRRLEKRILVDLPTYEARKAMFKHHLPRIVNPSEGGLELMSDLDYDMLALVCVHLLCFCFCFTNILLNKYFTLTISGVLSFTVVYY